MSYSKPLFVLSFILILSGCGGGGGGAGKVSNKQPVANAGNDIDINMDGNAQFDASLSNDVDGSIASYEWKEGSTVLSTAKNFEKSNFSIGIHNITLNVTDNQGATASDQLTLIVRETKLVFLKDDKHGIEPWMTNGTASGTYLVKDINQKQASSGPTDFVWVGDTLFFSAMDDKHGRELWISDGTTAGTRLLKDIIPGTRGANPRLFTQVDNNLFFVASGGLWKSDGTEAGTVLLRDFKAGYGRISSLREIDGVVYFAASDKTYGTELWRSDGTESGTKMVKDINKGSGSSISIIDMSSFVINENLYFQARIGNDFQLWKSDGTENGTVMLKTIFMQRKGFAESIIINNFHYFVARDGEHGMELWKTDGTKVGTQMVKDINAGERGGLEGYSDRYPMFSVVNNMLVFHAHDSVNGPEIWKTDGTESGTKILKKLYSGYGSKSSIGGVVTHKNEAYFYFIDNKYPYKSLNLWKTDGTETGTKTVKGGFHVPGSRLYSAGDYIYFTDRNKLWRSDGTERGTFIIKNDLTVHSFNYSYLNSNKKIADHNGVIYFSASDGTHGNELWKSDGTDAGTVMVKDINTATNSSVMKDTTIYKKGKYYYFAAKSESYHTGLWRTDGSEIGTILLKDFNEGYYGYNPSKLIQAGENFYFNANNEAIGYELWKSDGTRAGTTLLKDIYTGEYGSHPQNFISNGDITYFTASMPGGEALWKTDGTKEGTVSLYVGTNIHNRLSGTSYGDGIPVALQPDMSIINGVFYFSQINDEGEAELWKSDGTYAGTRLIKKMGEENINNLVELNGNLYFNMGDRLWKSDGTYASTKQVKDINLDNNYSPLEHLRVLNNKVYFSFDNDINGNDLWVSDGSASGTKKVVEANIASFTANQVVTSNNLLYFHSYPNLFDNDKSELWVSDGTNGGSFKLKNSLKEIYNSFEDGILFTGDDGSGTALWRTNGTEAGTEIIKALY